MFRALVTLSGLPFFILYINDAFLMKNCSFDHKFASLPDGKNTLISTDRLPSPLPAKSVHFSIVSVYILLSIKAANDELNTPCGKPELVPASWSTGFLACGSFLIG